MRLRRFGVGGLASLLSGAAVFLTAVSATAVVPHRSMTTLSSSNGLGALVYDATQYKITEFLEHPYQAASSSSTSRNFAYDSYPGIRIGTTGTWLNTVTPTVIEYLPASGIIHTQRTLSGLTIDEYDFAPMSLAENASVMLVKVTAGAAASSGPVDVYSLFNYQVGSGNPPSNTNEGTSYDAANDSYYVYGASNIALAFTSVTASSFHGSSPNNPYSLLMSGSNLMNDAGASALTGAVVGFQTSLGTLAPGTSGWAGWVTALASDANGQNAILKARSWVNARTPDKLLSDEQAGWASWITPAPTGASAAEAALEQQSQAMLRMGQVTESGAAAGQILAAITPGEWNITWVRDMAYSTVALVKSGHLAEAKAALAFQMNASVGGYQSYVVGPSTGSMGLPYQISVCRYYGNGTEWSDDNSNGPNIEFDGFGLFLWALDEYMAASNDTASLATWWPIIKPKVADVLVDLQDSTGLIAADSSIWEVHWQGQQRHFAYTTASAANGLCSASRLSSLAGESAASSLYFMTHGAMARDALISRLRGPGGVLGQSTEAILANVDWIDASTIDAVNWGLIDPMMPTAQATMSAMLNNLVPPSGKGFMRDQTGAYYDSQEWVFIDLRSDRAFALGGTANATVSTNLFAWNTAQAGDNFNELSELHDATTADYAGAAPMVGFGSGAYIIALADRGTAVVPSCGSFANETGMGVDGGVDASVDAGVDAAMSMPDGGVVTTSGDASTGTHDATTDASAAVDSGTHADGATRVDAAAPSNGLDAGHGVIPRELDAGSSGSSSGGCAVSREHGVDDRDAWSFVLPLVGLGLLTRKRRS